jgi:hypothetical protein
MIGQNRLHNKLYELYKRGKFPRFLILVGKVGSGRRTLSTELVQEFGKNLLVCEDVKVDTIRSMTDLLTRVHDSVLLIPDGDTMSVNAENSILKTTEEVPNDNHIIMTVSDINAVLPTIKSRALVFYMEVYKGYELEEYFDSKYKTKTQKCLVMNLATTPYEIDRYMKFDMPAFHSFVENVVDNVAEVSCSNALKIAQKIAFKDEEDKYPLDLFFNMFNYVCMTKMRNFDNAEHYIHGISITEHYLSELKIKGINKALLFDTWVLSLRKVWLS